MRHLLVAAIGPASCSEVEAAAAEIEWDAFSPKGVQLWCAAGVRA